MVCGSAPSMGSFAPSQAVVLHTSPETYPLWSPAQALTVPFGIQLRYKYAGTWLALRVLQALHLGCGRCTAPDPATPRHRAPPHTAALRLPQFSPEEPSDSGNL